MCHIYSALAACATRLTCSFHGAASGCGGPGERAPERGCGRRVPRAPSGPGRVAPAVSSCNCMASCEAKWTMPGPAKRTGSGRTRDRRSSPFVQRTESDASDAADRASKARKWISSDHEKRYFGASRIPRLRVSGTRAVCIAASDTEVVAWRRQRLPDVLALHQWPGRRTRPPDSPSLCGSPADDDASRPRSAREHATYFPHRD